MRAKHIAISIFIMFLISILLTPEYTHLKKTEAYVNSKLSFSMNNVIFDVFALETIMDNIEAKGYILESDMAYLAGYSKNYETAMITLEELSKDIHDFNFQQSEKQRLGIKFSYEYFEFFNRLENIYPKTTYEMVPSGKFMLSGKTLSDFNVSHNYITNTAKILREYYPELDNKEYSITEEIVDSNKYLSSMSKQINKSDQQAPIYEVHLSSKDTEWIDVLEKMRELHLIHN